MLKNIVIGLSLVGLLTMGILAATAPTTKNPCLMITATPEWQAACLASLQPKTNPTPAPEVAPTPSPVTIPYVCTGRVAISPELWKAYGCDAYYPAQ